MGCRCVSRRQVYGKHHCLVPSHHGKLLCVFKLNFPLCMHHVKTAGRGQVSVPVRYSIVNQFSHDTAALPSVHSTKLNHHPIFSHHHIIPGLYLSIGLKWAQLPTCLMAWRHGRCNLCLYTQHAIEIERPCAVTADESCQSSVGVWCRVMSSDVTSSTCHVYSWKQTFAKY